MGLTSAVSIPLSFILIRDILTAKLGILAAGHWQASWKISETYLMLITSTLSLYYLPRIAEIRKVSELKSEIIKVYKLVIPVVLLCALTIFLLRDFIIMTLFTPEFAPMRELFSWQLTGDVIKISSWILAYIMIGRAMVKSFIVSEILFSISFVLLSWLCVGTFGLVGVSIAYTLSYILYGASIWLLIKNEMQKMQMALN
jgi:PST family polysaccharide transporter